MVKILSTMPPAAKPGGIASVRPPAKPELVQAVPPPEVERELLYPDLEVRLMFDGSDRGPMTVDLAKRLLGWETESDYIERMVALHPKTPRAAFKFRALRGKRMEEVVPILLIDIEGNPVTTWNNDRNRPFAEQWCKQLAQDILQKNWAGPLTMPGETINCETIVISKWGRIESGQHRLVALILASQIWRKQNQRWGSNWPQEPVLETLLALGVSESSKVLQTLDCVKPRTLADTIYTSDLFRKLSSVERKECSRMLERAVNLCWQRTGAGSSAYQTTAESQGWIDRHPKITQCVKHVFEENAERAISNLNLSPGAAAGMMLLMAAGGTDGDVYRHGQPPAENMIDLELWDKAQEFWVLLGSACADFFAVAGPKGDNGKRVGGALMELVDVEEGSTGREIEKMAVIARAWRLFAEGKPLQIELIRLTAEDYRIDEHGDRHLNPDDRNDFGGIDLGLKYSRPKDPEPPSEEEIAAQKESDARKLREEQAAKLLASRQKADVTKAAKNGPPPPTLPPATKLSAETAKLLADKAKSRKQVEADQTAKAKAADAELAKQKKAPLKGGIGSK